MKSNLIMPRHTIKFTNDQLFKFGIVSNNLDNNKTPAFIKDWTDKVTSDFIGKNLNTYELI